MSWIIGPRGEAVVVTMRSDPVNKMNPAFYDDLHEALDRVERDHPRKPMVPTAEGATFSAGLDFEEVFPRFARADPDLVRVCSSTVAAVNGNAFAGRLILTLCCDHRIAASGPARFALT